MMLIVIIIGCALLWLPVGIIVSSLRLHIWLKYIYSFGESFIFLKRKEQLILAVVFPYQVVSLGIRVIVFDNDFDVIPIIPHLGVVARGPLRFAESFQERLEIVKVLRGIKTSSTYTRYTFLGISATEMINSYSFSRDHKLASILLGPIHLIFFLMWIIPSVATLALLLLSLRLSRKTA